MGNNWGIIKHKTGIMRKILFNAESERVFLLFFQSTTTEFIARLH